MATLNIRHTPESYDPKQRIVGGIVLVILMLLLYAVLKALLGISAGGAAYALRNALPEETLLTSPESAALAELVPAAQSGGGNSAAPAPSESDKPRYPVVESFTFLDLQGNPMQAGGARGEIVNPAEMPAEPVPPGEKRWIVQAGSFRELDRAEQFMAQLKEKQIESAVAKTANNWYAVRLPPQANRRVAEQQLLELRQKTGKKGLLLQQE